MVVWWSWAGSPDGVADEGERRWGRASNLWACSGDCEHRHGPEELPTLAGVGELGSQV